MDARVSVEFVCTSFGAVRLSKKSIDFLNKNAPDRHKFGTSRFKGMKRQKKIVKEFENAVTMTAWIEWSNGGVLEEY